MFNFTQFFNRKYPFQNISILEVIFVSIGIGLFIFILKPFGFINYENNKIIASLGFSLVTFLSLIVVNLIKRKVLQKIVAKWTIFKEFIFLNFVILLITTGNYFYLSIIIDNFNLSFSNFIFTIFLTFSIGIFPISFITLFRYNKLQNTNLGIFVDGNKVSENDIIKFTSLNKTDSEVTILKKDFLFIEAVKNNIHIYYYDGDFIKTISIRNTLKNIESQIKDKSLFRCHRSFIVNTNNIKTAKGNSNSYKIYFNNYNHFIPVSRSYTKEFQNLIY